MKRTAALQAILLLVSAQASHAQRAPVDSMRSLVERVEQLERRARTAGGPTTSADVRAGAQGFQLLSADGRYVLRLRGYFQSDTRTALGSGASALPRGFLLRRARPIVEATVGKVADVRIMPDFGEGRPTIYEAYLELRLAKSLTLRSGKFKPSVGLERLQSATDIAFIERANPNNLVPNRDVGTQLSADIGRTTLAVGVFNGVPDLGFGDVDTDRFKDLAVRFSVEPLRGRETPVNGELILAIAATRGEHRGSSAAPQLQTYRSPLQEAVFRFRGDGTTPGTSIADGVQARLTPQVYAAHGSLGLMAEYVASSQDVRRGAVVARLRHTAWETTVTWVLTGERASYRGVTPSHPFDPARHAWGALEAAVRLTGLTVDRDAFPILADPATSVRSADTIGAGLNWHLLKGVKVMLDYTLTDFTGGGTTADRLPEHNLSLRFQHAF